MQLHALSGLGRPLNFKYSTNRWLIISLTVLLLLTFLYLKLAVAFPWLPALTAAFRYTLTGFLSWALARELSPDKEKEAFFALAIGMTGAWLFAETVLLFLVLLLLSFRLINRSTGRRLQVADYLALAVLAGWLFYQASGLWAALVLAAAFWADSYLPDGVRGHRALAAALLLAGGIAFFLMQPLYFTPQDLPQEVTILIIVLATGFAFYIRQTRQVLSLGDYDRQPLSLKRVRAVQLLALLVAVVYSLWLGRAGFAALWPLWAAISGLLLGSLAGSFFQKTKNQP